MTLVAVLCAAGTVSVDALLCLAPALALSGALIARRYPGERLLRRVACRRGRTPRRAAGLRPLARPTARVPRGGLLLAFELAVRPPPRSLATS